MAKKRLNTELLLKFVRVDETFFSGWGIVLEYKNRCSPEYHMLK